MDKLQMAHEYLRDIIKASGGNIDVVEMPEAAWGLADAMQAEAEKRENKERPDVLKEEWQPDWSKAPEWANWWSVDENGTANFSGKKPHIEGQQWVYYSAAGENPCHIEAPSFDYQGNWKESLRKRPQ